MLKNSMSFTVSPHHCHVLLAIPQGYLANKAINWTDLDLSLDMVVDSGLYLGFEVMGNPGDSLFTSFKAKRQLVAWADLLQAVVKRYIGRYGLDHVLQWRFESWNGMVPAN